MFPLLEDLEEIFKLHGETLGRLEEHHSFFRFNLFEDIDLEVDNGARHLRDSLDVWVKKYNLGHWPWVRAHAEKTLLSWLTLAPEDRGRWAHLAPHYSGDVIQAPPFTFTHQRWRLDYDITFGKDEGWREYKRDATKAFKKELENYRIMILARFEGLSERVADKERASHFAWTAVREILGFGPALISLAVKRERQSVKQAISEVMSLIEAEPRKLKPGKRKAGHQDTSVKEVETRLSAGQNSSSICVR